MTTVIVVAPHPDDETLGCGGTLLRARADGAQLHWMIVSRMARAGAEATPSVTQRRHEIEAVAEAYGFASVQEGPFETTRLDTVPMSDLVQWIGEGFRLSRPDTVFVPWPGDVHSDHARVFQAATACCKIFRYPYVRSVYAYETLSETDFGMTPGLQFTPQRYVDIANHIDKKVAIMGLFGGEVAAPPFPRNGVAIRALATCRGIVAGTLAAEAFAVLREVV